MSTPHGEHDVADPFDLQRFVDAQAGVFERACTELRAGRKSTHWMWFVFPQLRGLGRSGMAWDFGISSIEEARAYLAHPLLGQRLAETTALVLAREKQSLRQILGTPDDLKFRSSMTLFALASGSAGIYAQALDAKCGGTPCRASLDLLDSEM